MKIFRKARAGTPLNPPKGFTRVYGGGYLGHLEK
jgi:hypothetical protein